MARYRQRVFFGCFGYGKALLTLVAAALGTLSARAAHAAEPSVCAAAFEDGQRLRRAGSLLAATERFRLCGGPECPAVMHAECLERLDEVERATPTIVVRVSPDAAAQATFSLDEGAEVPVDGLARRVDPGPHEIAVKASGFQTWSRRLLVAEGEQLKSVQVELVPVAESSVVASRWLPVTVASGVAVLAAGAGAAWALAARRNERALDDCAPTCTQAQVDHVKQQYFAANASFAVGAGSVAVAIAILVWPSRDRGARKTSRLFLAPGGLHQDELASLHLAF